jgi:hypothetical protein
MRKGVVNFLKKWVSKGFRLARFCRTTVLNICLKQALYFAYFNSHRGGSIADL